jgi:hypothetical protein
VKLVARREKRKRRQKKSTKAQQMKDSIWKPNDAASNNHLFLKL